MRNFFLKLTLIGLCMAIVMSVLSAYIRLSDLGIECEPWPSCFDESFRMDSEPGITIGQEDPFKGLRMTHRFMASAFGIVAVLMLILAWWYASEIPSRLTASLIFLLTMALAIIGMRTPDLVHPNVMLTNLLGGMALGALLLWQYLGLRDERAPSIAGMGMTILVLITLGSGAWVTANFAIAACQDISQCAYPISTSAFDLTRTLDIDGHRIAVDDSRGTILLIHYVMSALLLAAAVAYAFYCRHRNGRWPRVATILVVVLVLFAMLEPWLRSVPAALLHNFLGLMILLAYTSASLVEHKE